MHAGTGESGKSTIFKQMQILYQEGFSDFEKSTFRHVVRRNVVEVCSLLFFATVRSAFCLNACLFVFAGDANAAARRREVWFPSEQPVVAGRGQVHGGPGPPRRRLLAAGDRRLRAAPLVGPPFACNALTRLLWFQGPRKSHQEGVRAEVEAAVARLRRIVSLCRLLPS